MRVAVAAVVVPVMVAVSPGAVPSMSMVVRVVSVAVHGLGG